MFSNLAPIRLVSLVRVLVNPGKSATTVMYIAERFPCLRRLESATTQRSHDCLSCSTSIEFTKPINDSRFVIQEARRPQLFWGVLPVVFHCEDSSKRTRVSLAIGNCNVFPSRRT